MKKTVILATILLLASCSSEQKTIVNEHLNIIITPDLSNRIEESYAKPVADTELISSIYKSYYPDLYNIKSRIMGQEDILQFRFTNPKIINKLQINIENLKVDLSKMTPTHRITYFTQGDFINKLDTINNEIGNLYKQAKINTTGGDIYNYLQKEITATVIKEDKDPVVSNGTEVFNVQRNIIVLLTDGYIEAGLYGKANCRDKKCLYLSKTKVDEFRNAFLVSGSSDLKDFFKNSGYGIIPIKNSNLENTEVFVSEFYDRSLNEKTGSQTVSPNDFEIMKLFWSDWLEQSGVKHYKILDTANSKEEFLEELKTFITEA
jgi:hypothetical protein